MVIDDPVPPMWNVKQLSAEEQSIYIFVILTFMAVSLV